MAWKRKILKMLAKENEVKEKAMKIAQTVQTVYGIYRAKGMIENVNSVVDNVNKFIPSMQVMGKSFADSATIFTCFSSIATAAGIGANIVLAYQGVQVLQLMEHHLKNMASSLAAQTALTAQQDFPRYVHDMIRERITQTSVDNSCSHWFFIYHPDNDWYPGFFRIIQSEPIGPEFCGYTNQIDTAFAFMLAARARIRRNERQARKKGQTINPTKLHLLIPAYQSLLILEALKIPEEIGDFVMEGRIHSNRAFVWFNLPEDQRCYVQDIGHFEPPMQGWFDWAMSKVGLVEVPPKLGERRVLGTKQGSTISNEGDPGTPDDSEAENDGVHQATPLQHQYTRDRRRRRHRVHNKERHTLPS
ncbi:hypothetical protein F5Y07DRAFT_397904 [Xylaria sp. FL0933]|nr:hypothetical protein F5Y07DRAFT_397904 [Xylaria sp. FL0933]